MRYNTELCFLIANRVLLISGECQPPRTTQEPWESFQQGEEKHHFLMEISASQCGSIIIVWLHLHEANCLSWGMVLKFQYRMVPTFTKTVRYGLIWY